MARNLCQEFQKRKFRSFEPKFCRALIKAKGCEWRVFIAYRDLKRGGSNKTWVLGLRKQDHSHEVSLNPLDREIH